MKLLPAPLLSLSLLALWVMLQGSVDPGTVMLGALVAIMVPLMTQTLRPTRVRMRRPGKVLLLIGRVFVDVIRSNFEVAWHVWFYRSHPPSTQSVVIPLSVTFRYFPTIREEWDSIRAAMKMRGIRVSLEHIMVPLIFSAVNVAEELSAAALCRGLDAPGEHTSYVEVAFGLADYLAIGVLASYGVAVAVLKGCGVL